MKKMIVAVSLAALAFATAGPSLAGPGLKHHATPKHRPTYHHRIHEYRAQPDVAPYPLPHALDRRDPSRPGGLDPSFNPPRT